MLNSSRDGKSAKYAVDFPKLRGSSALAFRAGSTSLDQRLSNIIADGERSDTTNRNISADDETRLGAR